MEQVVEMSDVTNRTDGAPLALKRISSPVGDITIYATHEALIAIYFEDHKKRNPYVAVATRGAHAILDSAERDLDAYFSGKTRGFDTPIAMRGTPFQVSVWRGLLTIPFGETWSYLDLARKIGKPKAMRAVGMANSKNPISILVPCHRVIGANGLLTGYGGGLENKKWLIDHEARQQTLRAQRAVF